MLHDDRHLTKWKVAAVVTATFAASSATKAATSPLTRAPVIGAMLACRTVAEDARRLACFDEAVKAVDRAEVSGDLVTIDREQRRVVRKEAFGLTLPSLAFFDRGAQPDELDHVTVKIAEARIGATGRWSLRLDDGAVWRQIDETMLDRPPRSGAKAIIRKAMLGSFFMVIEGEPQIRVHRDN